LTDTTITAAEAKALREHYDLTQDEMAELVRLNGGRAIRKQEAGEHSLSGPQTLCLDYIMQYGILPDKAVKKNREKLKKLVDSQAEKA
jgi:DNA-binding transcriptional regulator YiaG